MNELALFAGAGGGILGGKLLGWRTVCAVEFNSYCQRVLLARQRDGFLPRFPIWDNVETFDGKPWRGHIDVVSGGFPCTDISSAGRGAGIEGKQSGLWKHMARIVGEVRPRYVFVQTARCLFAEDLPWSSVTLPRWGMMRDGVLWERTILPLRTNATASGYWRSPTSRDWKNARHPKECNKNGGYRQTGLNDQLCNKNGSTVAERNGQVTPEFCEWLMGFPIGWTESAPLEMPKFHKWLRSHGVCLQG